MHGLPEGSQNNQADHHVRFSCVSPPEVPPRICGPWGGFPKPGQEQKNEHCSHVELGT